MSMLLPDRAIGGVEYEAEGSIGIRCPEQQIALHPSKPNTFQGMSGPGAVSMGAHGAKADHSVFRCTHGNSQCRLGNIRRTGDNILRAWNSGIRLLRRRFSAIAATSDRGP